MHAIRQYSSAPPTSSGYEEVPDLHPGDGQVRIAVEAAGVHLVDTTIRQGRAGGAFAPVEAADDAGSGGRRHRRRRSAPASTRRWLGRRVVAHLGMASGGYAEQALAAVGRAARASRRTNAEAAVAMIGTGRTAMVVLEVAAIEAEDVVVVTAAAGGLGVLFVQAARNAGATVVGAGRRRRKGRAGAHPRRGHRRRLHRRRVAGPGARAARRSVGDCRARRRRRQGRGRRRSTCSGPGGRMILFGYSSGEPTILSTTDIIGRFATVTARSGPASINRPGGLRPLETEALAQAAAGRLVPLVTSRFRLADAALARTSPRRPARTTGKVVLIR